MCLLQEPIIFIYAYVLLNYRKFYTYIFFCQLTLQKNSLRAHCTLTIRTWRYGDIGKKEQSIQSWILSDFEIKRQFFYYRYVRPVTFFFDKYSSRFPRTWNSYSISRTAIKSRSSIFLDLFQFLSVLLTIILAIILAIHQHFCSLLLSFTVSIQMNVSSSDTLNPDDDNRLCYNDSSSSFFKLLRQIMFASPPTDNVHVPVDQSLTYPRPSH